MPSSSTITQRVFAQIPDKVLVFSGEYLRQLKIAGNWMRVRLGVLCAVTPNGTSNILDCGFFLGMCRGNQGYANYWTPNFIGGCITGASAVGVKTLTYSAGGNFPYYTAATTGCVTRKQETTTTDAGASTSAYFVPANATFNKRRAAYYVDITKLVGGSGASTVTVYTVPLAGVQSFDFRPDHFLSGLDQQGAPVINGQTCTVVATATVACGEALGPLDTFNLVWTRSQFPLEISALGASVIYSNDVYSTCGGADEPFNQYFANTGTSAGTNPVPNSTLNAGTNWGSPIILQGSFASNPYAQNGYAGTTAGFPNDLTFSSYGTGTITGSGTLNGGIGWDGGVYIYGSFANLAYQSGYAGTSQGLPSDNFESYGTGTVTSGVTINGGTGWQGAAYVY
jgi:hypothetical protein